MKTRIDTDTYILSSDNYSIFDTLTWAIDLFKGDRAPVYTIPDEVVGWGIDVIIESYAKAKDEPTRKMILFKIIHTREVVEAAIDIMSREKTIEWNIAQALVAAFLHDIGRFPQAQQSSSFSDEHSKVDHGDLGAELFTKAKLGTLGQWNIDPQVIKESIKLHNKYEYTGENEYVKLTRDSDKLALFRYVDEIYKRFPEIPGKVSKECLDEFLAGKVVNTKHNKTTADYLINMLSWKNDLCFKSTIEICAEEQILEGLLSRIRDRDEDAFKKIS